MAKAILLGNVKLKRAYEAPAVEDGTRILVDRLWPRGIKKADAAIDLWMKGYLAMGIVMLVQSCVTLVKTVRDMHESGKLVNRIEDAKAERLLMEVERGTRAA